MCSLFTALYGSRFAVQSSDAFAKSIGYPQAPIDDLLVFHMVIGKTVPDISRNAIANLGYAEFRFLKPVYPGDTLASTSDVIGLKENSNEQERHGLCALHRRNQHGEPVLSYARWVMVNKRDENSARARGCGAEACILVDPEQLGAALPKLRSQSLRLCARGLEAPLAGLYGRREDRPCRRPDDRRSRASAGHPPVPEHRARAFQSAYREQGQVRPDRLVYGGHIISIARSLSFNGLANAFHVLGLNGARHAAPSFAGDTIYAWSEITGKAELPGQSDIGALTLRTFAVKDRSCADFPGVKPDGSLEDGVVLDMDYWVALPR